MTNTSTRSPRFHAIVVREPGQERFTIVLNDGELSGYASREEAGSARDSLRRAAAARGEVVHATGCCG